MELKPLKVRTIVISDVHLGTFDCKIREVNHFLKYTRCEKLILNGDIIDGWRLKQTGNWTKAHTRFIRLILKKLEKKNLEVIYLRGNHDDVLAKFLPIDFENLRIVDMPGYGYAKVSKTATAYPRSWAEIKRQPIG